jgi:DNA-binding CsgD family transcriptional regulator
MSPNAKKGEIDANRKLALVLDTMGLPMRQVQEVLRLKYVCGQSERRIAASLGISRHTVGEYLRRAAVAQLAWPVPAELDDKALEAKLFAAPVASGPMQRSLPDWAKIHAELATPQILSSTLPKM